MDRHAARDGVRTARSITACVYRGFCRFGCATNAKQSALTVWIPRALKAGAEIRDLAMVGRIETAADGHATGVHYIALGRWHFHERAMSSSPAMRSKPRGYC